MAVFKAALVNEFEKLYKKKKAWVAVVLSLLVIVTGQTVIVGMRSGLGLRGVGSGEFPLLVLSVVMNTILPLFAALVAIDSFSGEYAQNSMRIALTRPVSRLKVFTAKFGAVMLFVAAMLVLLLVFSLAAGFIFNANSASFGDLLGILLAYTVSLLPLAVLALGIILLANIFKNGTLVFFVSVLLFLVFKALALIFYSYSSLFLTSHLEWYQLFLMDSLLLGKILRQFLIMLGSGIMLFTAGYFLFDKKEF